MLVNALTHVNYAFAFIHPTSFLITTMDALTPGSLFNDFADLKIKKPSIKIWLSLGGWTFSDDGTPTQPVFGNIARNSLYRKAFASNLLGFLNEFGFDGVDIDWYVSLARTINLFLPHRNKLTNNPTLCQGISWGS